MMKLNIEKGSMAQRMPFSSQRVQKLSFRAGKLQKSSFNVSAKATSDDQKYMERALELAAKAKEKTFPNPAVGCVIVKNDRIIGEGYHPKAGMPHAEVYALRAAGNEAEGAIAYVTLEPCNHYGQTPPCSRALVEANVSKAKHPKRMNKDVFIQVVVGIVDPNPQVGGSGIKRLEAAGIEVVTDCLKERCYDINSDFMERMSQSKSL